MRSASEAAEPFVASRDSGGARPRAPMPDPGDLLRGAQRIRRRPAGGRAGRAEPGAPPLLSEQRLRRRLPGLAPHAPAASSASPARASMGPIGDPRCLGPRPADRGGGAGRQRLSPGRPRHPIITRPRSALIGRRAWSARSSSAPTSSIVTPGSGSVEAFSQAPAEWEPEAGAQPRYAVARSEMLQIEQPTRERFTIAAPALCGDRSPRNPGRRAPAGLPHLRPARSARSRRPPPPPPRACRRRARSRRAAARASEWKAASASSAAAAAEATLTDCGAISTRLRKISTRTSTAKNNAYRAVYSRYPRYPQADRT